MSSKKKKYYVVWQGKEPGIYTKWEDCKKQIEGIPSPVFKSFKNPEIARKAFLDAPDKYIGQNYIEPTMLGSLKKSKVGTPIFKSLSVDAACSGNPGILEYKGVDTNTKKEIFHLGPFPKGTVNLGEFLALVHGLAYLKSVNSNVPVYTDSITAMAWVRKKATNTNLSRTAETEDLFKLVDRALIWIKNNKWDNKILKWETEFWGEIPADFGRK